jgi:hypothetical protein
MVASVWSAGAPTPSADGPRVCRFGPPSHLLSSCSGQWIGSAPLLSRGCGVFGLDASCVGSAALWLEGALLLGCVVVSILVQHI